MKNKVYIYSLLSTRDNIVKYIGKTEGSIKKRLTSHIYESRNSQTSLSPESHKNRWIRKEVRDGFSIYINLIEETDFEKWEEREKYWISYYGRENLVNGTDGGRTLNRNPNKNVSVSFEKLRITLFKRKKKDILEAVTNIHLTKYDSCLPSDVVDKDISETLLKLYPIPFKNSLLIEDVFSHIDEMVRTLVSKDIKKLKYIYSQKYGKEILDILYKDKILQKFSGIPENKDMLLKEILMLIRQDYRFPYDENDYNEKLKRFA